MWLLQNCVPFRVLFFASLLYHFDFSLILFFSLFFSFSKKSTAAFFPHACCLMSERAYFAPLAHFRFLTPTVARLSLVRACDCACESALPDAVAKFRPRAKLAFFLKLPLLLCQLEQHFILLLFLPALYSISLRACHCPTYLRTHLTPVIFPEHRPLPSLPVQIISTRVYTVYIHICT